MLKTKRLTSCLKVIGYILLIGTAIAFVWSLPNYFGQTTTEPKYMAFLIFGLLLESAKTLALGFLCLTGAKLLETSHD